MLCRSNIDKFVIYMYYTLGTYFTPKFLAYYTLILEEINKYVKKLLLIQMNVGALFIEEMFAL